MQELTATHHQHVSVTVPIPAGAMFLPVNTRRVLAVLTLRADALGVVQLSLNDIMRLLGHTRGGGSLSHVLRDLCREGLLTRERRGGGAMVYRLTATAE